MIRIHEVIVVEGKYDRLRLNQFIEGTILETHGFGIFHNADLRSLLSDAAMKRGLIVMTDSDNAGFHIRRYLRSFIDESHIRNVYVPAIKGKEKRKKTASASGVLGVEGLTEEIIINSLLEAGVRPDNSESRQTDKFESIDLYRLGLSGKKNSRKKLGRILKILGLPEQLSKKETLEILNLYMSKSDLIAFCAEHEAELSALD